MDGYTEGQRARAAALTARPTHMAVPGAMETGPSSLVELTTDESGRLPSRGRHYERIRLEASPHYSGEFLLHLDSPENGSLRVGLDVGDLAELRSALPGRREATADEVRLFLAELLAGRDWNGPEADAIARVLTLMRG